MSSVFKESWNSQRSFNPAVPLPRRVLLPIHTAGKLDFKTVPGIARKGRIQRDFAFELQKAGEELGFGAASEKVTAFSGLVNELLDTGEACTWNVIPYESASLRSLVGDEGRLAAAGASIGHPDKIRTLAVVRQPFGEKMLDELIPDSAIIGIKDTLPARAVAGVTGQLACGMVLYDYQAAPSNPLS